MNNYRETLRIKLSGRKVHHTYADSSSVSCGIVEISDLPTNRWVTTAIATYGEKKVVKAYKNMLDATIEDEEVCMAILSDTLKGGKQNCKILSQICTASDTAKNPNSGNIIQVFVYTP